MWRGKKNLPQLFDNVYLILKWPLLPKSWCVFIKKFKKSTADAQSEGPSNYLPSPHVISSLLPARKLAPTRHHCLPEATTPLSASARLFFQSPHPHFFLCSLLINGDFAWLNFKRPFERERLGLAVSQSIFHQNYRFLKVKALWDCQMARIKFNNVPIMQKSEKNWKFCGASEPFMCSSTI